MGRLQYSIQGMSPTADSHDDDGSNTSLLLGCGLLVQHFVENNVGEKNQLSKRTVNPIFCGGLGTREHDDL